MDSLPELSFAIIKIAFWGAAAFIVAFLLTPTLTGFLYKHRLWRKSVRTKALGGGDTPYFQKFHGEGEIKTPRFGGVLIWVTPPLLALIAILIAQFGLEKLNFVSRSQTWLPLATLVAASAVGLADDILQVIERPMNMTKGLWDRLTQYVGGGLSLRHRFVLMGIIGLVGAWWFFAKLGWSTIYVPGIGDFAIGIWYIPFFLLVMLATYSGGVIDGIDGLSGGVLASSFSAYAAIAFLQGQVDLAVFSVIIVGAILAFLWFNIPPARFYMGETGMMGLTATLTVIAFLTDAVLVLPIIAFLLVVESASVIIQVTSKKLRGGKKVFLAAPIHHHLEAIGWPQYKITMRFWVIGIVMAVLGVAIQMLG
ncbi:MAG TPA: hypothetical protein ENI04_00940 [Candidatus Wildermuthbacteria bacterium]|nr:hypothetical protein [Candidatus Wildermuthbacteria bacterium]